MFVSDLPGCSHPIESPPPSAREYIPMNTRSFDFVQLDVFTRTRLTGNPLAVFTDARGLSDAEMQAVAREMNLSETTFILPREPEVEAREGKKVRIFTVEEELPFAGHPTLGTALYIYSTSPAGTEQVTLDLKVGKIPVRFRPESAQAGRPRPDGAVFGEMRQRDPEFGPVLSLEKVAAAIGVSPEAIATEGPIQVVSTGLPFTIVPLRNNAIATLKNNSVQAASVLQGTGARFFYFVEVNQNKKPLEVRARMFFYGGEDPATGSAAGAACSWLVRHALLKSDEPAVIRQGVEAGRASDIFVHATLDGEQVTNVHVGGYAVEVLRGIVTM